MIGTHLSHFRITARLGEGGMGEVYRAEDTKLGREVALKLLPASVTDDPERLGRFQRESRALAALSHPNIAGIHQIVDDEERPFIVMELVEGEDLAERLARGALPTADALQFALQLTEAIEAAHARGVVHRDLKPANIKITRDNQIKVLDFGLAKALDPADDDPSQDRPDSATAMARSPTLTAGLTTGAGMILGTAAYMSPEQARGQNVDRRADIWAFGLVLHEMLTGRRTFTGTTATDVIAQVITRDPDWDALPHDTPDQVRRLLKQCTQKDPRNRLHDIADARIALTDAVDQPEFATVAAAATPAQAARARNRRLALGGAAVAGMFLGGLFWHLFGGPATAPTADDAPVTRLTLEIPPDRFVNDTCFSRDGQLLAYIADTPGDDPSGARVRRLYLRAMDDRQARAVPDTEGVRVATFSPDGRWIAYVVGDERQELRKIPVDGGPSQAVLSPVGPVVMMDLEWRDDGRLIVDRRGALVAVPMGGGAPEVLFTAEEISGGGFIWIGAAIPLPGDDDRILLTVGVQAGAGFLPRTEVVTLSTKERRTLSDDIGALYLLDDILVGFTIENVVAARFDVRRAALTGPTLPLFSGGGTINLSPNGTLLSQPQEDKNRFPAIVDGSGELSHMTAFARHFDNVGEVLSIRWSPDGSKLAAVVMVYPEFARELFVYDVATDGLLPLRFPDHASIKPAWSPDGDRIAFSASAGNDWPSVYIRSSSGSDRPRLLLTADEQNHYGVADWSPDGSTLLINHHRGATSDIVALDIDSGRLRPFVTTDVYEHSPAFSSDGRWVAFRSDEAGQPEVYVARFSTGSADDPGDGNPRKFRISTTGGRAPEWSPDMRTLYYVTPDRRLVAVPLTFGTDGDAVTAGAPRDITEFDSPIVYAETDQSYDPHPDGRRVVVVRDLYDDRAGNLQLTLNWHRELQRRMADVE